MLSVRVTAAGAVVVVCLSFLTAPARACDDRFIKKCEKTSTAAAAAEEAASEPAAKRGSAKRVKVVTARTTRHARLVKRTQAPRFASRSARQLVLASASERPVALRSESPLARRFRGFIDPRPIAQNTFEALRKPHLVALDFDAVAIVPAPTRERGGDGRDLRPASPRRRSRTSIAKPVPWSLRRPNRGRSRCRPRRQPAEPAPRRNPHRRPRSRKRLCRPTIRQAAFPSIAGARAVRCPWRCLGAAFYCRGMSPDRFCAATPPRASRSRCRRIRRRRRRARRRVSRLRPRRRPATSATGRWRLPARRSMAGPFGRRPRNAAASISSSTPLYSDAAISAKVIRPDPAAYTRLTKDADGAAARATAFFDVSERFLVADRKVARDEAVMTYDPVASSAGDRLKSVEAALQAAKPCPELYQACRGAYPAGLQRRGGADELAIFARDSCCRCLTPSARRSRSVRRGSSRPRDCAPRAWRPSGR